MAPRFLRLLVTEWARSFSLGRSIVSGLLVFLLLVFFFLNVIGISVFLGLILKNSLSVQDVPGFLNRALIFYFLAECSTRFIIQKRPGIDLRRFLHLPVKRSGIVHFQLWRSLFSPFTLVTPILFLPITITDIYPAYGTLSSVSWFAATVVTSQMLHWLVMWLRNTAEGSLATVSILFLALAPFFLLYFSVFDLGSYLSALFGAPLKYPAASIVLLPAVMAFYVLVHRQYQRAAYIDADTEKHNAGHHKASIPSLFKRMGRAGQHADMELKLILRHKKSRNSLYFSFAAILYGLIFYQPSVAAPVQGIHAIYLFSGIFVTGFFAIQYGQFFLSWNSSFFDFHMVQKNGLENLVRGKMLLLSATTTVAYLLAIPYLYFGWHILAVHTAAFLYNIGIGNHIIARLSLWQPKPMDINKSAMFNYEGVGFAQIMMAIPMFVAPYIIYLPVNAFYGPYPALAAVGALGVTGIIFHRRLIHLTTQKLHQQKHPISSSFRQGT